MTEHTAKILPLKSEIEEIKKGKTVKDSILSMSRSVGTALLLATFTTVFAFLSNYFSPVGLIKEFGILAAVGPHDPRSEFIRWWWCLNGSLVRHNNPPLANQ